MPGWDEDYLYEEVRPYIEIEPSGIGHFQFGFVSGDRNCVETQRENKPAIEWSWEGMDEMDECSGRGWATVEGDELRGMIYFYGGDHSDFVARRAEVDKGRTRK